MALGIGLTSMGWDSRHSFVYVLSKNRSRHALSQIYDDATIPAKVGNQR